MKDDRIHIRGNKEGINLILNIEEFSNFEDVTKSLVETLSSSKGFYRNSILKLTADFKDVTEDEIVNLKDQLFEKVHIKDCIFEDISERENTVETRVNITEDNSEFNTVDVVEPIEIADVVDVVDEGNTKFVKKTVRGGQYINYPGNVVVIGDVNNGSEICATGNIIVLGAIKGRVRAGLDSNRDAIVAAFTLKPELLQIGDIITISPEDGIIPTYPEVATIKDGLIVVEPYLPNKYI